MSNDIDPVFKLSNLSVQELLLVEIEEASEGRSFGRRFKVNAGASGSSEALLFRDILDDVKAIAKEAKKSGDLKKFEAVNKLLVKMDKADSDAELVYKEKGCGYRSLTFISRLFQRTHSKRIGKLQTFVTKQMDALDPLKRLAALKNNPDVNEKNMGLEKLADEFFNNKDYDHCVEAIKEQSHFSTVSKDLIEKTAESYLTNDEPEKALETINLIKGNDTNKDTFIAKVADHYFINENFDKALETAKLSNIRDNVYLIGKITNFHFENKEFDKAEETLNLGVSSIYLPQNLIEKFLDKYIEDMNYEKAWEILPNYKGNDKFDYTVKLGNLCCDDNDFENAHKVIESIHNKGYLHNNEKRASEALIKRVVTHYCESGKPQKALEIVEPMFVTFPSHKDLAIKNGLLKEITNAFIAKNQFQEALNTNDKILQDFKMNNEILMEVPENYFSNNDPRNALTTIEKCNRMHFKNEVNALKQKYQDDIDQ